MKLSLLIPTLNEHRSIAYLRRLRAILDPQLYRHPGQVEIVINDAGRFMPTGKKRNLLIEGSTGDYFSFIDVDDIVPDYYVARLLEGIEQDPDIITFKGFMTTNDTNRQDFTIKLGSEYVTRNNHHYRYPNHLCCFKRSLVEHVKFEPIWVQEDYKWATEIMKKRLLQKEYHIEEWMYHYDYRTDKPKYRTR
jgi:glycosyltransferase involved in cell wall biosynthesis